MEGSSRKADHAPRSLRHSVIGSTTVPGLLAGVGTATDKPKVSRRSVFGILARILLVFLTLSVFFEAFRLWNFAHASPTQVTHVARRHEVAEYQSVIFERGISDGADIFDGSGIFDRPFRWIGKKIDEASKNIGGKLSDPKIRRRIIDHVVKLAQVGAPSLVPDETVEVLVEKLYDRFTEGAEKGLRDFGKEKTQMKSSKCEDAAGKTSSSSGHSSDTSEDDFSSSEKSIKAERSCRQDESKDDCLTKIKRSSLSAASSSFLTVTTSTSESTTNESAPTSISEKRSDRRPEAFGRQDEQAKFHANSQTDYTVSRRGIERYGSGVVLEKRLLDKKKGAAVKATSKAAVAAAAAPTSIAAKAASTSKIGTAGNPVSTTMATSASKPLSTHTPSGSSAVSGSTGTEATPERPANKPSSFKGAVDSGKQLLGGYKAQQASESVPSGAAAKAGQLIAFAQNAYKQSKQTSSPPGSGAVVSGSNGFTSGTVDATSDVDGTTGATAIQSQPMAAGSAVGQVDGATGTPGVDPQAASGGVAKSGQGIPAVNAAGGTPMANSAASGQSTPNAAASVGTSDANVPVPNVPTDNAVAGTGTVGSVAPVPEVPATNTAGGKTNSPSSGATHSSQFDGTEKVSPDVNQAASAENVPVVDTAQTAGNNLPAGSSQSLPAANQAGITANVNAASKQVQGPSATNSTGSTTDMNAAPQAQGPSAAVSASGKTNADVGVSAENVHVSNAAGSTPNVNSAGGTAGAKAAGNVPVKHAASPQGSSSNGNGQPQKRWDTSSWTSSISNTANNLGVSSLPIMAAQKATGAVSSNNAVVAAKGKFDQARGYVDEIVAASGGGQASPTAGQGGQSLDVNLPGPRSSAVPVSDASGGVSQVPAATDSAQSSSNQNIVDDSSGNQPQQAGSTSTPQTSSSQSMSDGSVSELTSHATPENANGLASSPPAISVVSPDGQVSTVSTPSTADKASNPSGTTVSGWFGYYSTKQ